MWWFLWWALQNCGSPALHSSSTVRGLDWSQSWIGEFQSLVLYQYGLQKTNPLLTWVSLFLGQNEPACNWIWKHIRKFQQQCTAPKSPPEHSSALHVPNTRGWEHENSHPLYVLSQKSEGPRQWAQEQLDTQVMTWMSQNYLMNWIKHPFGWETERNPWLVCGDGIWSTDTKCWLRWGSWIQLPWWSSICSKA